MLQSLDLCWLCLEGSFGKIRQFSHFLSLNEFHNFGVHFIIAAPLDCNCTNLTLKRCRYLLFLPLGLTFFKISLRVGRDLLTKYLSVDISWSKFLRFLLHCLFLFLVCIIFAHCKLTLKLWKKFIVLPCLLSKFEDSRLRNGLTLSITCASWGFVVEKLTISVFKDQSFGQATPSLPFLQFTPFAQGVLMIRYLLIDASIL